MLCRNVYFHVKMSNILMMQNVFQNKMRFHLFSTRHPCICVVKQRYDVYEEIK